MNNENDLEEIFDETMENILFDEIYKNYKKFTWIKYYRQANIIEHIYTYIYVNNFKFKIQISFGFSNTRISVRSQTLGSVCDFRRETDLYEKVKLIAKDQFAIQDIINAIREK